MKSGSFQVSLMRLRYSIAALAWFTAIVAIAAALPPRHDLVGVAPGRPGITRVDWRIGWELSWELCWELLWRGAVVVALCIVVWLFRQRGRGLPPY